MRAEVLLGIGLRLLSIFLILGPILIAFSASNWDLKKTLIQEDEIKEIEEKFSGLNFENLELSVDEGAIEYNEATKFARIPVMIYSRMKFSFDILELEVSVNYDGHSTSLSMQENRVKITPYENTRFHLVGVVAEDPRGKSVETELKLAVVEKLGVTLEIKPRK
ncbi:MAG: hypothetical protein QXX33_02490 [Candidatus Hadarchaeales archaeon]